METNLINGWSERPGARDQTAWISEAEFSQETNQDRISESLILRFPEEIDEGYFSTNTTYSLILERYEFYSTNDSLNPGSTARQNIEFVDSLSIELESKDEIIDFLKNRCPAGDQSMEEIIESIEEQFLDRPMYEFSARNQSNRSNILHSPGYYDEVYLDEWAQSMIDENNNPAQKRLSIVDDFVQKLDNRDHPDPSEPGRALDHLLKSGDTRQAAYFAQAEFDALDEFDPSQSTDSTEDTTEETSSLQL